MLFVLQLHIYYKLYLLNHRVRSTARVRSGVRVRSKTRVSSETRVRIRIRIRKRIRAIAKLVFELFEAIPLALERVLFKQIPLNLSSPHAH